MADYSQFVNAIKQAGNVGAAASSIPVLANAMLGSRMAGAMERTGNAFNKKSAVDADEEERRRREAAEAARQKALDAIDPKNYQKVRKDDGGFAFYDASGKEIDIDTFAKFTGQRRVDVLKDSENPVDLQYIDDWSQMNELNQAVWRNDQDALANFAPEYQKMTPEQMNRKLLEKYPHIYGMGNYEKSRSNLGKPVFRSTGLGGSSITAQLQAAAAAKKGR